MHIQDLAVGLCDMGFHALAKPSENGLRTGATQMAMNAHPPGAGGAGKKFFQNPGRPSQKFGPSGRGRDKNSFRTLAAPLRGSAGD